MNVTRNMSLVDEIGFTPYLNDDSMPAMGCPINNERKLAYRALLYVIPSAAGLAGGIFRLPNSFVVPIVGGCAHARAYGAPCAPERM